jgi:hypothetical protein
VLTGDSGRHSTAIWLAATPLIMTAQSVDPLHMTDLIEPGSSEWCTGAMRSLIAAVHDLALSAGEQIALFERERFDVDELALSYHDAYQLVPQLEEQGWITNHQRSLLDQIDRQLADLTNDRTARRAWLWSDEALSVEPRWIAIRRSATELLPTLHHE